MRKIIDLTGQRFGRLIAIRQVIYTEGIRKGRGYWFCQCDCGKTTITSTNCLRRGHTTSCGCYRRSLFIKRFPRRPIFIVNFKTGEVR